LLYRGDGGHPPVQLVVTAGHMPAGDGKATVAGGGQQVDTVAVATVGEGGGGATEPVKEKRA